MKKIFCALLLAVSFVANAQVEIKLMPDEVRKLIGSPRSSFEGIVGSPTDSTETHVCYEVFNTYDKVPMVIHCGYSKETLVSIMFPTRYYLGYWLSFVTQEGYPKRAEAEKRGLTVIRKDIFGEPVSVKMKWKSLGLHIMDIHEVFGVEVATINYFTAL